MAIGTSPLFDSLQGSAGPIDFRTRRNGKIEIGKKRIPANPQSARQLEVRAGYGRLHELWQNASYIDKAQYERLGKLYHISAWNAFLLRHQSAMSAAPSASWGMVESSGTDLHDLTTNKNHGTISGATWEQTGQANISYLKFDGIDDEVNCGNHSSLLGSTLNGITLNCWFSISELQSFTLMAKPNKTGDYSYTYSSGNDTLYSFFGGNTKYSYISNFSQIIQIDKPQMATAVLPYHNSPILLYFNGVPIGISYANGLITSTANNLYLGSRDYGFLKGDIMQSNIYNHGFSQSQILQYYENTKHLYGVYP